MRRLLQNEGIDVAGVASRGAEALGLAETLRPDVTLVDIGLGGEDGFEVARQLAERDGHAAGKIILISTHSVEEFAELIEASPAIGFISKSALSAKGHPPTHDRRRRVRPGGLDAELGSRQAPGYC